MENRELITEFAVLDLSQRSGEDQQNHNSLSRKTSKCSNSSQHSPAVPDISCQKYACSNSDELFLEPVSPSVSPRSGSELSGSGDEFYTQATKQRFWQQILATNAGVNIQASGGFFSPQNLMRSPEECGMLMPGKNFMENNLLMIPGSNAPFFIPEMHTMHLDQQVVPNLPYPVMMPRNAGSPFGSDGQSQCNSPNLEADPRAVRSLPPRKRPVDPLFFSDHANDAVEMSGRSDVDNQIQPVSVSKKPCQQNMDVVEVPSVSTSRRGRSSTPIVKDEVYYKKRVKNNQAAKRSRESRKKKEDRAIREAEYFKTLNIQLVTQNKQKDEEIARLHKFVEYCFSRMDNRSLMFETK